MGFLEAWGKVVGIFKKEEASPTVVSTPSVVPEKQTDPSPLVSNRRIVLDVMAKNFCDKPCSIYDIETMLDGTLNHKQVGKALKDLCRTKRVSRVKRGIYLFSNAQDIKEKGFVTLSATMPLDLIAKINSFCGNKNKSKTVSLYISKQLTSDISVEEFKEEASLLKKDSSFYCVRIPRGLHKTLKVYAEKRKISISTAVRCFFLRWCKEQASLHLLEAGNAPLKLNKQINLTVARVLRMKKCRDLDSFCQATGVNKDKYKYWEWGRADSWKLATPESMRIANYLNVTVETIVTPDGDPVFISE